MKCSTASEQRARHWAEFKCQREREEQQWRDEVIAHFGGDRHEMAEEILRYRRAVMQLAAAIDRVKAGVPFGMITPGPYCKPGRPDGVHSNATSGTRSGRDVNG
jgi:hypothetical protein